MSGFFDKFSVEHLVKIYGISRNTAVRQLKWCCRFVRFNEYTRPQETTARDIYRFISHLRDEEYSQSSINEAIVALRRLVEFAGVKVELSTRSTGGNYRPPDTLSQAEVELILEALPQPEATACGIVYAFAQNVSDVVKIRVSDYISGVLAITGRQLELSPDLRWRFEQQYSYAEFLGQEFVFFSKKGEHISQALIHSRLKAAAKELGIWRPVNSRVLRASGITHILEKTGNPAIVAALTGLKPKSIKRYLPLDKPM